MTLKIDQILIKLLIYPIDTLHGALSESIFGSGDIGCRQAFVESKFDIQSSDGTLKMRPKSPKSDTSFPCPNGVSVQVWSKSVYWFRRKSADKTNFYSLL